MDLVMDVREWLRGGEGRKRVVALHCKGGKGRTGTMVCAILIDQDLFKARNIIHIFSKEISTKLQGAGDTLQYFGQRRTDLNVSKQFQGVETYSQVRQLFFYATFICN